MILHQIPSLPISKIQKFFEFFKMSDSIVAVNETEILVKSGV